MSWVTFLAALASAAPALAQALFKVAEKVLVEPLQAPATEQMKKWVQRGYKAKVDDAKLRRAIEAATRAVEQATRDDYPWQRALNRLAEPQRDELREVVVAAMLTMTGDSPQQIPDKLLRALGLDETHKPLLARFLWAFRAALVKEDDNYRALAEFARGDAGYARLLEITAAVERLAAIVTPTPEGEAIRVKVVEAGRSTAELNALWKEYMDYLVNSYRRLDFRGVLQTKTLVELPLAEVYVSLNVAPTGATRDPACETPENTVLREDALREQAKREKPLGVVDVLQKEARLVVLGDPGAGKTTFLRYVALALAEGQEVARQRLGLSGAWLPIYLPLAAYNQRLRQGRVSLEDYVLSYWDTRSFGHPAMEQLVARALQAGRVLLLLDGLDEVGSRADRLAVARQVEVWANAYGPRGNRVLVSSRIVGYEEAPLACDFRAYTLNPFGPEEIARFAQQWCVAYRRWADPDMPEGQARSQGEAEARQLVDEIRSDDRVEALASNPLLITIIALIHYKGTRLPDHRVELYDLCIKTLVETWREARSEFGAVGSPLRIADEIKVLAPFALWLQEQAPGPGGAARRDAVRAKLVELLMPQLKNDPAAAETEAEAFLELGQKQTGLLVERGEGWFGFFHPTFKEYLAARACVLAGQLLLDKTWAVLQKRLDDALWREVILLTVGYKAIMQSEQEAAAYLIEHIAAEPDRRPEARGGNVVLAGRCLVDIGHSGVTEDCWDAVMTQLVPIMQNQPESLNYAIPTRYAAAETLDRLGWLPDGLNDPDVLDVLVRIVPPPATRNPKPFYIAKYPLTNHQFARFIVAGGYENPLYWGGEDSPAWRWRMTEHNADWRGVDPVTQPEYWDNPRFGKNRRGYPVVGISWYEANAYCAWLTEKMQEAGSRMQVWENGQPSTFNLQLSTCVARLPAEEEWLLAVGGSLDNRYPWGPKWDETRANTSESNLGGTSPVGMYPAGKSPAGVWDMGGNVWEWTASKYDEENRYTLRGGAWNDDRNGVGFRGGHSADNSHYNVGVRVGVFVP